MSRIANMPVSIPDGVNVNISGNSVDIKGSKGELSHKVHALVSVLWEDDVLRFKTNSNSKFANALAGTTRALIQNLVIGVSQGYEKKLVIVGVGHRAQVQGKTLNLTLGFSHPVNFEIPEGITIDMPSQTEMVVKGIDKQKVGQVAANIRAFRPPEPYKGKGIKYVDEVIIRKEAKKI